MMSSSPEPVLWAALSDMSCLAGDFLYLYWRKRRFPEASCVQMLRNAFRQLLRYLYPQHQNAPVSSFPISLGGIRQDLIRGLLLLGKLLRYFGAEQADPLPE